LGSLRKKMLFLARLADRGESPKPVQPERESSRLSSKPLSPRFRRYLLALPVFTLGNSRDAFLLARAGELGVPVYILPLLWLAFSLVKSVGNVIVGREVDRVGARLPLVLGWAGLFMRLPTWRSRWHRKLGIR
jgi:hypothetical protein